MRQYRKLTIPGLVIGLIGLFILLAKFSTQSSHLEQIQQTGILKVATQNGATTYYESAEGPTGIEYELVNRFAQELGVQLEIEEQENTAYVLEAVAEGTVDIGAAAIPITTKNSQNVMFANSYQSITQQIIYHRKANRPKSTNQLVGRLLAVSNDAHDKSLKELQKKHPALSWEMDPDIDPIELLELVNNRDLEFTVVDSHLFAMHRVLYPDLKVAFDISTPQQLAWAIPKGKDTSLQNAINAFLNRIKTDGSLQEIVNRYQQEEELKEIESILFTRTLHKRLPKYEALLKEAGAEYGIDWILLAAISYQESHWDPDAVSSTGVKGFMMLTNAAAKEVGVTDRTDTKQSLYGGIKYLLNIKKKLPESIIEPDRTWFALATYNVGLGHIYDVRKMAQQNGTDPNKWVVIKKLLPLLQQQKYYEKTRHGYARGWEPVRYVERIRRYYDLIKWSQEAAERRDLSQENISEDLGGIVIENIEEQILEASLEEDIQSNVSESLATEKSTEENQINTSDDAEKKPE